MPDKYKARKIIIEEKKVHTWTPQNTMGMIYGGSGCGKTTELEKLEKKGLSVFIIDCDRGGQVGKNIAARSCFSYEDVCDTIYSLPVGKFDIISIDSIDILCDTFIRSYFQQKTGLDHPGDMQWGQGWDMEKNMLKMLMGDLSKKKSHIILIGHSSISEDKNNKNVVTPYLRGKLFDTIKNLCQYVIYIKMIGGERVPVIKNSQYCFAKDRTLQFPTNYPNINFGASGEFALTDVFVKNFKKDTK